MGGDAKSPQHTVVHPMYVSYSCIPTATSVTISPKITSNHLGVHTKSNASNTNSLASLYNQNLKQSNNAAFGNHLNNKPEIRYTELSTEQLVVNDLDDGHENYLLKNMKTFGHNDSEHDLQNHGYVPTIRPNRNQEPFTYDNNRYNGPKDYDGIADENNLQPTSLDSFPTNSSRSDIGSSRYRSSSTNQYAQQVYPYDSDQIPENYVMPVHYVTRSPNLNRSSSRKRKEKFYANVYDQIRDAPPGYDRSCNNYSMQRVRSHDRLSNRRNNGGSGRGNKNRPRSYCSNGSFPEAL